MGWITALTSMTIRSLVEEGSLQMSLFDEQNLAEITASDYPGERLMACHNPVLGEQRRKKREKLLQATEKNLTKISQHVARGQKKPLTAAMGVKVGKALGRYKMGKHFAYTMGEGSFTWSRRQESIAREQRLDGICVLRASVAGKRLSAEQTVRSYKSLAKVERAFRCPKGMDLLVRPICHRTEDRAPAHIFLCVLAYYVEWHLRHAWAPLLFADEQQRQQRDPVPAAQSSASAQRKKLSHPTDDGLPAHSFRSLLDNLAARARVTFSLKPQKEREEKTKLTFRQSPEPTPLQARAHESIRMFPVAAK